MGTFSFILALIGIIIVFSILTNLYISHTSIKNDKPVKFTTEAGEIVELQGVDFVHDNLDYIRFAREIKIGQTATFGGSLRNQQKGTRIE